MPVLVAVTVLDVEVLPVIVFVAFVDTVFWGLEELVLLTVELRDDVCVLVVVFVEVPDSVPIFVICGDCVIALVLVEDLLLVPLIVGKTKLITKLRCS